MWKKVALTGCLLGALTVGAADAQVRGDKAVYFTFSQPVALPQVTLPAGKYLFRLADSMVNRTIVQIYSADGAKLHAMLMTMPTSRQDFPNDPEIRFIERPADRPATIGSYWYPGERTGWEFIYPRQQAMQLAKASRQPVLTTAQDVSADRMNSAEIVRVDPEGAQVAATDSATQTAAIAANRQQGEVANDAPALAPVARTGQDSTGMTARRTSLPSTASAGPTVLLVGVLALLLAGGIRARRLL